MYNNLLRLIACVVVLNFACQKNYKDTGDLTVSQQANSTRTTGAIQISGVGFFDAADVCNSAGQGASYALTLTGDLEGCHYFFVEEFDCSPSGTYREQGRELFVGTYNGEAGTFWTTYRFEAKFEGCNEDGTYVGAEILGRCQHPIVAGSGTGVFEGVTGRLDFKDDIEAGNFPYRGHLRWE
jgi:hypothetical protein